jgi:hypothetical protein
MSTGHGASEDDRLLEALGEALRALDAVPPEVVTAAKEAFTWRTIDDELLALSLDSLTDDQLLAGVRGRGPRSLTFEDPDVAIEIEVVDQGQQRTITGQATAEGLRAVQLHAGAQQEPIDVQVDELGRFHASDVPAGPLRIRVLLDGDPPRTVATEWVTV